MKSTKDEKGAYNTKIRNACYILQDSGVAQSRTSTTLQRVYKALTGEDLPGPVPSYKTQNTFNKEMKAIARTQVKEMLKGEKDTTLK